MADATPPPKEQTRQVTLPVTYETIDVPLHGCDHVIALGTPDKALVLQMFSTTPPVVDDKDGSPLTEARRKCVGQFHITPTLARRLIQLLQEQISFVSR